MPSQLPCATFRSPAKINWWLRILNRRPDGYHNLETLFQRLTLADDLHITPLPEGIHECRITGFPEELPPERNLIHRAWRGLVSLLGVEAVGGFSIHVTKRIPTGGGLGGGSSNAATALLGILALRGLDLTAGRLHSLGANLGADVPFFLQPSTLALGTGTGVDLRTVAGPDPAVPLLLAFPAKGMATAEAYRRLTGIDRPAPPGTLHQLIQALQNGDHRSVAEMIHNDFELVWDGPLAELRKQALACGAWATFLCGSGSTVAILLPQDPTAQDLLNRALRSQFPGWSWVRASSCGPESWVGSIPSRLHD